MCQDVLCIATAYLDKIPDYFYHCKYKKIEQSDAEVFSADIKYLKTWCNIQVHLNEFNGVSGSITRKHKYSIIEQVLHINPWKNALI